MKDVSIKISKETHEKLIEKSKAECIKMGKYADIAINEKLAKEKKSGLKK